MKVVEFLSGLQIPISNEEADLLNLFDDQQIQIAKTSLTERQQVLANQLVYKGILIRRNQDGAINYTRQTND